MALTKHKIVSVNGREVTLSEGDLSLRFFRSLLPKAHVAIDIETNGLSYASNQIGSIQVYDGIDSVCIIRPPYKNPKLLAELFADVNKFKIFHHALFDLRFLKHNFDFDFKNIGCTKIAAKILLPHLERHSLIDLVRIYLSVDLNKSYQTSNWMEADLSVAQLDYAVGDVIYLPKLLNLLIRDARKKGVYKLLKKSFDYIPYRVELDLMRIGDVFVY